MTFLRHLQLLASIATLDQVNGLAVMLIEYADHKPSSLLCKNE